MCRMCLATFTDTHIPKTNLIHEMMVRASHDELGQKDGWGVTDTHNIWRSAAWYFDSIPDWTRWIDSAGFIFTHLRKASVGTSKTLLENHPYTFNAGTDDEIVAMHNGYFGGVTRQWQQNQPNTDSYHALSNLATLIPPKGIRADLIGDWLSQYNDDSHYAVLLHWRNSVYALRGKTRTLAAMEVGNGYLLHTNIQMLHFARAYLDRLHSISSGVPELVPEHTLVRFPLAGAAEDLGTFTPIHRREVTYVARWDSTVQNVPKQLAASEENNVEEARSSDVIVAPSVTKPRTSLVAFNRQAMWSTIAGKLSPMREQLSALWACSILGYMTDTYTPDIHAFCHNVTKTELEVLTVMLFTRKETGYIKPFSANAMLMLNWWNHLVKRGQDAAVHVELFDVDPFWLDPTYTLGNICTWQKYVLRLIQDMATSQDIQMFFDMKQLARELKKPITASTEAILSGGV